MEPNFMRYVEETLDDLSSRLKAAELALVQIPQINFQADPSRPPGVLVEPVALLPVDGEAA